MTWFTDFLLRAKHTRRVDTGHPATPSSTTSTASCERRRVPKRQTRVEPRGPRRMILIANIVGKFAGLLQNIGRQRMSEVEQQGRRAVLVYY